MIDLDKIEKLMALMAQYGVEVVQAEAGKERISLAKNASEARFFDSSSGFVARPAERVDAFVARNHAEAASAAAEQAHPSGRTGNLQATNPNLAAEAGARRNEGKPAGNGTVGGYVQKSELVGTFYRAASPTAASFTDVGKRVKKGQTLCIVEAMKIMNEIEAEIDGEIAEILVENGKPVEFGTPLFVIKPA